MSRQTTMATLSTPPGLSSGLGVAHCCQQPECCCFCACVPAKV